MFWNARKADERYIHRGRVACPRSPGDVEVDLCYGCRFMREIQESASLPFVRCRPRAGFAGEVMYRMP
jgi:hypothetical protein